MSNIYCVTLFVENYQRLSYYIESTNVNVPPRSPGGPLKLGKGLKYPADIIESVQMDGLDDPKIKIEFAGMEESDEEATISAADDDDDESEEDEDEEEEIVVPIKKKKLQKSKTEEDIHSFL
ncbi:unnamed protein product [Adineta steineri]|uniref:Uncharacterized protein n=1 Tax=Adineta steineri TaxID=433720 RepID=A0A815K0U6_9BILA|nr:unnamed protein product [Adineta steineri]CAF1384927.1 unnamed protein product [Adineta steineri]